MKWKGFCLGFLIGCFCVFLQIYGKAFHLFNSPNRTARKIRKMEKFSYVNATSLEQVTALLSDSGWGEVMLIAGGTDLLAEP